MTGPYELEPIEPHIRTEEAPDDAVLVVRAGPLAVEKLLEHARRQETVFSYRGMPMTSVSVDATVGPWTLEAILRDRLWSRSSYGACPVAGLRQAGFGLLPTHEVPHYDVVLSEPIGPEAARLLALFGEPLHNPYKRRWR